MFKNFVLPKLKLKLKLKHRSNLTWNTLSHLWLFIGCLSWWDWFAFLYAAWDTLSNIKNKTVLAPGAQCVHCESKISWYRKTTFDSIVSRTPGVPSRVCYQKNKPNCFLSLLHGRHQISFHVSKFRALLAVWFGSLIMETQYFPEETPGVFSLHNNWYHMILNKLLSPNRIQLCGRVSILI